MKIHRVGTITLGTMLLLFGILFLLRIFLQDLSYEFIFRLWPVIFIFLGLEILFANYKQPDATIKLAYDKTAVFLIIILTLFAMGMAIAEVGIDYANKYMDHYYNASDLIS